MPTDLEVSDIFYQQLFDTNNQDVDDNQKDIKNAFNKQFSYQDTVYTLRGHRFDNTSHKHILEVDEVVLDRPHSIKVEDDPQKNTNFTGGRGKKKRGKSKKKKTKRKQKRKSKKRKSRKRSKTKRR